MKTKIIAAALALTATAFAAAAPAGESSEPKFVDSSKASTILPFGAGKASLKINNGLLNINIGNGPVKYINHVHNGQAINGNNYTANVSGTANPKYLTPRVVAPVLGFFPGSLKDTKIGQVWYEKRAANIDVYSVRQTKPDSFLINKAVPHFGGLVIGQVKNLSDKSGVYFGEWSPRGSGADIANSTEMNMKDKDRTVWYAGDNPTGSTKGLANVTYDVVGINQHVPGQNDFYRGKVTAKFSTAKEGTMSGGITRNGDTLSFNNAKIDNTKGTFTDNAADVRIRGRFFGKGAEAMAGIAERSKTSTADDIAFGGRKQ